MPSDNQAASVLQKMFLCLSSFVMKRVVLVVHDDGEQGL